MNKTMTRFTISTLVHSALAYACFFSVVPAIAKAAETSYWSGSANGTTIRWTDQDLKFFDAQGKKVFSLADNQRKQFRQSQAKSPQAGFERNVDIKLLSVVGPYVSFEEDTEEEWPSMPHPETHARFATVDVRKPLQPVSLTDIFPESDLLQALSADSVIKKAIGTKVHPATLAELLKRLENSQFQACPDHSGQFALTGDILTRFAFHHIDGDKVFVRIGLSNLYGANDSVTQIGIALLIPAQLKQSCVEASSGKKGFMMSLDKSVVGDKSTSINLTNTP